jgi:hypothetical protein
MELHKPATAKPGPQRTAAKVMKAAARTHTQDRYPSVRRMELSHRARTALWNIIGAKPSAENTRHWVSSHEQNWWGILRRKLQGRAKTREEVHAFFAVRGYHETELGLSTRAKTELHGMMGAYPTLENVQSWLKLHEQDWERRFRWRGGRKTHEEIGIFFAGLGYRETGVDFGTLRAQNALERLIDRFPLLDAEKIQGWMKTHNRVWERLLRWRGGRKTGEKLGRLLIDEGLYGDGNSC